MTDTGPAQGLSNALVLDTDRPFPQRPFFCLSSFWQSKKQDQTNLEIVHELPFGFRKGRGTGTMFLVRRLLVDAKRHQVLYLMFLDWSLRLVLSEIMYQHRPQTDEQCMPLAAPGFHHPTPKARHHTRWVRLRGTGHFPETPGSTIRFLGHKTRDKRGL